MRAVWGGYRLGAHAAAYRCGVVEHVRLVFRRNVRCTGAVELREHGLVPSSAFCIHVNSGFDIDLMVLISFVSPISKPEVALISANLIVSPPHLWRIESNDENHPLLGTTTYASGGLKT